MDAGRAVAALSALVVVSTAVLAGVASAGPSAAVAAPTASTAATSPEGMVAAQEVDPDTVLLEADVAADGTARWQVEYLVRLDDENATDAFESVATDVRDDPSRFTDRFADRMGRTVASAENATGREMALRNVSVAAERQDLGTQYGVVRYRFTWTNFAAANDTTVRAGDALGGFFLDGETQLTVRWPDGYRAVSVSPPADEQGPREAVWQGRRSFGPDGPQVVASATATATATNGGPGPDGGDGSTGGNAGLFAAAAVAAVVALAVAWVVTRRRDADDDPPAAAGEVETGGGTGGSGDGDVPGGASGAAGGTGGAAASASDATGDDEAADDGDGEAADDDGPPEELLSNEERVMRLLEERGGRIKQQAVASELDWTDAKTSQVVKGMREDDEIDVFRLGRENVITLPDEDDI